MSEDGPLDPLINQTTGIRVLPAMDGKVLIQLDDHAIEGTYFDAIELAQTLVAAAVLSAQHLGVDAKEILRNAWR